MTKKETLLQLTTETWGYANFFLFNFFNIRDPKKKTKQTLRFSTFPANHWIGLRENLQESSMILMGISMVSG